VAGILLSDERINGRKLAGIAAGFAGVVVMIGPKALSGLGTDLLAQVACLGGAMSYAFAGAFGRRFKRLGIDPIVVAAGQVTGSTLVLAPLALVIERPWELSMPVPSTWAAIVGLAVLSTALAYILYFQILQRAGATNLLLVTFLIPASAIALGVAVLGEELNGPEIAGMVLIGVGLLSIDGRVLNIGKRRSANSHVAVRR
jgi:drug/metabolite transporter (DMT)-like permease